MHVAIRCPNPACGKIGNVPDQVIGRNVRCTGCGLTFSAAAEGQGQPSSTESIAARSMETVESDRSAASTEGSAADKLRPAGQTGQMPTRVGKYEIRARLGAGAFGAVYRAYDPTLEREVALKVPHPGTLDSQKSVERFLREAKSAAKLQHPHIVPVHEAGTDESHHYIAAAFIEGKTLSQAIQEGKIDYRQAARICHEIADALAFAHERGVVHRDVKPANVMLDQRGKAYLMDFGLAHREDASHKLTADGAVMGTPAYMAPEQASGQQGEPIPASDQYSLGVLLYELLTGQTPFKGPPAAVIYHVINSAPPPPRTIQPDIPLDLQRICLKAMAKAPADRYANMREMADALAALFQRPGTNAKPAQQPGKPASQRPLAEKLSVKSGMRPKPTSDDEDVESAPSGLRRILLPAVAVLVVVLLAGILYTVVFRVSTKAGTLVVEVDQPGAEVTVDGQTVSITMPGQADPVRIEVDEGTHQLKVTKGGFETYTKMFSVKAGKAEVVKVRLDPVAVAKADPKQPDTKAEPKIIPKIEPQPKEEPKAEPKVQPKVEIPPPMPEPPPAKKAVPAMTDLEAAEKTIKELFKDEYVKKLAAERIAFAEKLYQQGLDTKDDPAARFVLLRDSSSLAAQGGSIPQALKAIDELGKEFQINRTEMKAGAVEVAAKTDPTVAASRGVYDASLNLLPEAVEEDDYDSANRLLAVATAAAQRAKSVPLITAIQAKRKEVEEAKKRFDQFTSAMETLQKSPDDQDANLQAGKYLCYRKGKWDRGLPLLVKGSDKGFSTLAAKDLENPTEPSKQADVGDGWWAVSETLDPASKKHLQLRAAFWYSKASPALSGLTRTKIDTRLSTLPEFKRAAPSAFYFDGKSRIVTPLERFAPATLEAWVYPENSKSQTIQWGVFIGSDIPNPVEYGISLGYRLPQNSNVAELFTVKIPSRGTERDVFSDKAVLPLNTWSHVCAVFGQQSTRIYLNGQLVGTGQASANRGGTTWVIGNAGKDNHTAYLVGKIRSLRISKGERYNKEFTPPPAFSKDGNAVLIYDAQQVTGDKVIDLSGNNNSGVIQGVRIVTAQASAEVDREVVARILELGGDVRITSLTNLEAESYVKSVKELPADGFRVRHIGLSRKKITAADYTLMSQLTHLRDMVLEFTNTSDQDLALLLKQNHFRRLDLKGTQITDASLRLLEKQDSLNDLVLNGTSVSQQAVQQLRTARPGCGIHGK